MAKRERVLFIDLLSIEEITKLYKHFAGVTQVKFRDRQDAEIRLLTVSTGKLRPTMMTAFEQVGVSKETIGQFGEMLRGPIALPQGTMKPEDVRRHAKALAMGKAAEGAGGGAKAARPLRAISESVLWALQQMIPSTEVETKGEDATVSSTDVATKLSTNITAVCKGADDLAKRKLIKLEDDSNLEHQFYWLSLLPAGRELVVSEPQLRALPNPRSGPSSNFSNKFIFRLVTANPRREGTHGWTSFNLVRDGMSYEEYKKAGGRNNDLQWDLDKKFVELRDSADATGMAPVAPPASSKKAGEIAPSPDPEATLKVSSKARKAIKQLAKDNRAKAASKKKAKKAAAGGGRK